MKKLLLLLFLIPNLVITNELPKSCKKLPQGDKIIFKYDSPVMLDEYQFLTINNVYKKDINFDFEAISYDLNDDGNMEIFVQLKDSRWCGSSGCRVDLLYKVNNKWKIQQSLVQSATTISIKNKYMNGYKIIYTKSRGYGSNKPGECPYSSGKLVYNSTLKIYEPEYVY